jgi:hypothetical protein
LCVIGLASQTKRVVVIKIGIVDELSKNVDPKKVLPVRDF